MAKDAPDGVTMITTTVVVDLEPIIESQANEYVVDTYGTYSGSSSDAQTLFSRTIASGRVGILEEIELACDNYTVAQWYIAVKSVVILNWEKIPMSFTKKWPMLELIESQEITVQVKSDGSSTINAYADISYKEVG